MPNVDLCIQLANWGFGISENELKLVVKNYCMELDIKNNFTTGLPGRDWIYVVFLN